MATSPFQVTQSFGFAQPTTTTSHPSMVNVTPTSNDNILTPDGFEHIK